MPFLFSKNDVFVDLGHGIKSSGCNLGCADVSFRVKYGAPQVRSLRRIGVSFCRGTPPGDWPDRSLPASRYP